MCTKAETFSSTGLDEYRSAKRCLDRTLATELEIKARRILSAHGVPADPRCNVRLDLASGPRLLLRGVPQDAGRIGNSGGVSSGGTFLGAGPNSSPSFGVSRRRLELDLVGERAGESHSTGAFGPGGGCASGIGGVCNGCDGGAGAAGGGCASPECQATTAATSSAAVPPVAEVSGVGGSRGEMTARGQPAAAAEAGQGDTRLSQRQVQELVDVQRNAERDFLASVTKLEEEHSLACDRHRDALKKSDAKETYQQEYMLKVDARVAQEDKRLALEKQRLLEESRRRKKEEAERRRRKDAARLRALWASDGDFFRVLSVVDLALASAVAAFRQGFSLAPAAILDAAWRLAVAECTEGGDGVVHGGGDGGGGVDGTGVVSPLGTSSGGAPSSFPAGAAVAAVATQGAAIGAACGSAAEDEGCGGIVDTESALRWAWSAAGSTAGAVIRTGYSSAGWLLGQTLHFVTPEVQCEVRAVVSLVGWLLSLILAMKIVGGLLGPGGWGPGGGGGGGPVCGAAQWVIVAAWVWGRFRDWVVLASRELCLFVAPAAVLVLAYGAALRYVERHRRPDGRWWVRGWDVRAVWSRALPAVASGALACLLGAQAA